MTTGLGACFMCGEPASHAHFYDAARGFFAVGEEPRTCEACGKKLDGMSKEERAAALSAFAATAEPPRGRNALEDAAIRSSELRRRAKS